MGKEGGRKEKKEEWVRRGEEGEERGMGKDGGGRGRKRNG